MNNKELFLDLLLLVTIHRIELQSSVFHLMPIQSVPGIGLKEYIGQWSSWGALGKFMSYTLVK